MICLKDHPLVGEFIKCMMLALVIRMIVAQLMRIPKNHQATELFHKHIFLVGMLLWLKVIKKKQTTDEHSLTTKSDHHVFCQRKGSSKVSIFDYQQSHANTF